jgi:hypothetical protein
MQNMARCLPSIVLRLLLACCAILAVTCRLALAQTEGRFTIGPQVSFHRPVGSELENSTGFGVSYSLSRPKTHSGWGPDFGFGWFHNDFASPLAGNLTVRPLLGGYGYTLVQGKFRYHFAALTGPGFAKVHVFDADRVAWSANLGTPVDGVDVKRTAWIVKPGARVTYSVLPRLGIFGSVDYEIARLTLQIRTLGQTREQKLKADQVNFKVGFNVGVFQ